MTEEYFIKQDKKYYFAGNWIKGNNGASSFSSYEEALTYAKNNVKGYFRIVKFYYI